jgi:hypothetical protein
LGEFLVEDQRFLVLALVEQLMGAQDGVAVRVAGHAGPLLENDADLRVGGDTADRLLRDAGGIALHFADDLDHALAQGEESPLPLDIGLGLADIVEFHVLQGDGRIHQRRAVLVDHGPGQAAVAPSFLGLDGNGRGEQQGCGQITMD